MLAKEAIAQAKALVLDLYSDEQFSGVRLEEVELDEPSDSWLITLSILRPTFEGKAKGLGDALKDAFNGAPLRRTYKLVRISNDGSSTPSMKMRELQVDE